MLKILAFATPVALLFVTGFVSNAQAAQPSVLCSGSYHHEIVKGDARRADDACVFRCWYDENARYCETASTPAAGQCVAPTPKAWAYLGGKFGVMSFQNFRSVPCKPELKR
jgi:hypothetical protein